MAKSTTVLPPKRITIVVSAKDHKNFKKAVAKKGSTLQKRLNELIQQDLAV